MSFDWSISTPAAGDLGERLYLCKNDHPASAVLPEGMDKYDVPSATDIAEVFDALDPMMRLLVERLDTPRGKKFGALLASTVTVETLMNAGKTPPIPPVKPLPPASPPSPPPPPR